MRIDLPVVLLELGSCSVLVDYRVGNTRVISPPYIVMQTKLHESANFPVSISFDP